MKSLTYSEIQRRIAEVQRTTTLPFTEEELAARAAIEAHREEPYAEAEWTEAKSNLRAFFGILAEWNARP